MARGDGDGAILLHGLARHSSSMNPLARALRRDGLRVSSLDQLTRRLGIAALAGHVERASARWRDDGTGALHLVGHSLGGLVARAWIARHRPARLGRVVLLGSPNGSSEIADLLADQAPYQWVFGPAGAELTTHHRARDAVLGDVDYPLGVIAGTRALDPFGWMLLPKPNDGNVSVARRRCGGASDVTGEPHADDAGAGRDRRHVSLSAGGPVLRVAPTRMPA